LEVKESEECLEFAKALVEGLVLAFVIFAMSVCLILSTGGMVDLHKILLIHFHFGLLLNGHVCYRQRWIVPSHSFNETWYMAHLSHEFSLLWRYTLLL